MSEWFVWNFGTILLYSAIGGMTWLTCQSNELKAKVKSPVLVGLAASLVGAFELGLSAIVSGAIYMLFLHVFKYWYVKLKGKDFESFNIDEELDLKKGEETKPSIDSPKVASDPFDGKPHLVTTKTINKKIK